MLTGTANGSAYGGLRFVSGNAVVFGAATGLGTSINVTTLNGTNGFSITGVTLGIDDNHIGSAGDFNGDGFADVIFSNNAVSGDGGVGSGDACVIFGQATGFAAAIDISSLTTPTTTTTSTGSTPRRLSTPSRLFGQSCDP